MMIKTNFRSNKIHVWHTNPNYSNSTFYDNLRKVKDQKQFYQTNIYKTFDVSLKL